MVVTGVPVAGPGSMSVRSSNPCGGHCCRAAELCGSGRRSPVRECRWGNAGPHFRASPLRA